MGGLTFTIPFQKTCIVLPTHQSEYKSKFQGHGQYHNVLFDLIAFRS
jgi:hypothetical protein